MAKVVVQAAAIRELGQLPAAIQTRVTHVFERLAEWPRVSGAKPLPGELKGHFRVRTGDYRVIFTVVGDEVIVWRIGYRGSIYD